MKYPKIPRDLRQNVKATKAIQEKMRLFREKGLSLRKIARELGLSYTTVQRYLMSPEKRAEERTKLTLYNKVYRARKEIKRNRATQRKNRAYRKELLGESERRYKSLANMKARYKTSDPQELFRLKKWHEKQIALLLEVEPLLILIR